MRASRLLKLLMMLQARPLVTAEQMADACEVSIRTIYRDVDALSAAGVPVYADRGAAGGYRLLDGYRTRLNGLSADEAEAMFLSGLPGPAEALGLGGAMAAAQLKLVTALPSSMRSAAEHVRNRFHLDAPGWFHKTDTPAHLRALFQAVWANRMVDIRYRSWKAEKRRRVCPLGLVLKGGAWYLVGSVGASIRTYFVGRIRELAVCDDTFQRPAAFDLAAHWSDSTQRLEAEMHPGSAMVRLTATGMKMAPALLSPYVRVKMKVMETDAHGASIVSLPIGSLCPTTSEMLRFGDELEVLAPRDLRQNLMKTVTRLGRLYGSSARKSKRAPT